MVRATAVLLGAVGVVSASTAEGAASPASVPSYEEASAAVVTAMGMGERHPTWIVKKPNPRTEGDYDVTRYDITSAAWSERCVLRLNLMQNGTPSQSSIDFRRIVHAEPGWNILGLEFRGDQLVYGFIADGEVGYVAVYAMGAVFHHCHAT